MSKLISKAKRAMFEAALEIGNVVIRFNTDAEGVIVPDNYLANPDLALRFGMNLQPPINDLEIGKHGVTASLLFGKHIRLCSVPWSAVHAVISEVGTEHPFAMMHQLEKVKVEVKTPAPVAPVEKPRPKFGLVPMPTPETIAEHIEENRQERQLAAQKAEMQNRGPYARHPSCLSDCNAPGCTGGCRT